MAGDQALASWLKNPDPDLISSKAAVQHLEECRNFRQGIDELEAQAHKHLKESMNGQLGQHVAADVSSILLNVINDQRVVFHQLDSKSIDQAFEQLKLVTEEEVSRPLVHLDAELTIGAHSEFYSTLTKAHQIGSKLYILPHALHLLNLHLLARSAYRDKVVSVSVPTTEMSLLVEAAKLLDLQGGFNTPQRALDAARAL